MAHLAFTIPFTEVQIEAEAERLYEHYRAIKPTAVGGAVLPSWKDNQLEAVKTAWRGLARANLLDKVRFAIDVVAELGKFALTPETPARAARMLQALAETDREHLPAVLRQVLDEQATPPRAPVTP